MEFKLKPEKRSAKVKLVEGVLSRYTGKELLVGYGKSKNLPRRKMILLARKVVSLAKQNRIKSLNIHWKDIRALAPKDFPDNELGELCGTAFVMANYEHVAYKTKPKEGFADVEVVAVPHTPEVVQDSFWRGHIIGTEVNACRELSNTPGGDMTPKVLAAAAKRVAKGTKVTVKVLGRREMQKLGMGAVLGIAKGSVEEPQFIVMEYKGASQAKPIVLVGKGVTFDTGGLNIKPGDHMYEMHMDMSGGAAVIHAVALAAKLKVNAHVIGLIPAVENSPSGNAVRPGDVLKSLSGKTIEVLNTDAEGRVILADAITYAKRYNPMAVVDVATLTGAATVALGLQASAFMTNEKGKTVADFMRLAEASGDYMWPMPLWEEYDDMVKGNFADVPNISTSGNSRDGGVIAGGKFLEVFAKELNCLWAHIDMAPRMTAAPNEFLSKGAAGAPVRFLLAFIESYAHGTHR